MQTKWTMVGVLCALMVVAVVAQGTSRPDQSRTGSDQSRSGISSSMQQQQQQVDLARGSSIIGAKVVNAQGEDLGKIHDVVLNSQRDQINYAVLAHGGVAGIGEKLIAIPWSEFSVKQTSSDKSDKPMRDSSYTTGAASSMDDSSMRQQSSADQSSQYSSSKTGHSQRLVWNRDQEIQLTLSASKDQLDQLAGLDRDRWPEQISANWQQRQAQKHDVAEMSEAQQAQFDTRKLSKVIGTKVESATPITFTETSSPSSTDQSTRESRSQDAGSRSESGRTEIGKIKDCVLNSDNGHLIYCVVSLDDVPNHGRDFSVVPWDAVRMTTTQDNKQIAQLQITSGQNLLAFTFRSNQQPDLADRNYLERVYTAYNVEPQWEALGFVPPSGSSRDQMQQQRQNRMQQQQQQQDRQYQRQSPGSSGSSTDR